jgi:hypothetical protein
VAFRSSNRGWEGRSVMAQSDLEKIVRRCQTDEEFYQDMLKDLEGTLKREDYKVTEEELEKIRGYLFIEKAKGRFDDFA